MRQESRQCSMRGPRARARAPRWTVRHQECGTHDERRDAQPDINRLSRGGRAKSAGDKGAKLDGRSRDYATVHVVDQIDGAEEGEHRPRTTLEHRASHPLPPLSLRGLSLSFSSPLAAGGWTGTAHRTLAPSPLPR
eukprot:scaffold278940_cov35-Tisochrysis_lutea.AAC.1